jgi:MFS family permease
LSLEPAPPPAGRTVLGVSVEILVLGAVSFLTDVSSELIFSVLPVFVTGVLGASAVVLGTMEGLADFAASSLDLVSGYLSDRTGKRKSFAALGYGFSAAAKALLPFAASVAGVVVFRVVERLGKSVRGAPRDALIGSISSEGKRGLSFGVHKALDRAGAVLGPLVAYYLLDRSGATAETFHRLFLIALVPAVLAVLVLALLVRDRPVAKREAPLGLREAVRALPRSYWSYVLAASIFSLAYFSYAFLLVNALRVGFSIAEVPLLYALWNVTFTVVSIPLGGLGDRIGRRKLIGLEFLLYEAMLLVLILVPTRAGALVGFVLYGIFFAIDEGQSKAYLTDLSGKANRATAIGVFNFLTGMIYLPASLVAGAIWETEGPGATFAFAALVTAVAAIVFLVKTRPAQGESKPVVQPSPERV